MTCCSGFCGTADRHFSKRLAARDLRRYRRTGPGPTTQLLRDGIAEAGTVKGSLLDIGSGVGALAFELLDLGMASATAVDASSAYLAAAAEEAERRHRTGAFRTVHADFLAAGAQLPPATVVTLDRVVCCYPSYRPLLEEAVRHSLRRLALSYPRDVWYVRTMVSLENQARRLSGNPFRSYVHPPAAMAEVMVGAGFALLSRAETRVWAIDVYERRSP
jgi:magnesium-protoporphyrin O-methyltransferase